LSTAQDGVPPSPVRHVYTVRWDFVRSLDLLLCDATQNASALSLAASCGSSTAQCRFTIPAHDSRLLTYTFSPELTQDGLTLHVALAFTEGETGADTLQLPTQWAGEKLGSFSNLRVSSQGAKLEVGADPAERVIHAKPGHPVGITYDLVKDWTGPFVNPLQFHPVITPEYLEFTGSNALVRVKLGDQEPETANFDWTALPISWSLATSFGSTTVKDDRCQTYTGPWRDVNDGLYSAGDFRIRRFQINGQPAVLAVRSDWTFTDEEAMTKIQAVVGLVRAFWKDNRFPYFLVTLAPYDRDHGSSDGSAFTNAFWMFVSRRDSLNGLLAQLAHESFHAWDPMRMGIIPSGHDEADIKWFREVPTEYYAQLFTLRAGNQSAADYISSLNKDLRRFPESTDEYVRGRIISLCLDGTIREESHGSYSLENVMFDMVNTADRPYKLDRILATMDSYLSPEARDLLHRAVTAQGNLKAPSHIPDLSDCATPLLKDVSTFDLGLDFDRSRAAKAVVGVVENGPTFAAGLRNGQVLLGYSVTKWEPDHLACFRIHTESGDKKVTFYPRGHTIQAWQYELMQDGVCAVSQTAQSPFQSR
jgi:predicted metalloprotease with PDZ domain